MFDIILSININNESLYKFSLFHLYVLTNVETLYFSMKRKERERRKEEKMTSCMNTASR